MEKFGVPFTVYVTTGMVTREIDAWWHGLAELIRSQDRIELPALGRYECADRAGKERTYKTIETAIHADFSVLPHVRAAIEDKNIDCSALTDRQALTEQQLRQLAPHPLVTIGGRPPPPREPWEGPPRAVACGIAE